MVVVAYGVLLPVEVLNIPHLGCVNIHGSLLPRWRGAAPIHRAILSGDSTTGITIMRMDEGLDTGPVLSTQEHVIEPGATAADLHDALADVGAKLLLETLEPWCRGSITEQAQQSEFATYAAKLEKQEAMIDWTQSAAQIDRQIRAFNPWPVAETLLQGERTRIWKARVNHAAEPVAEVTPGKVLRCQRDGFWVQTGEGVLAIEELQLPGKRAVAFTDFVNGRDVTGVVLGASGETG